MCQPMKFLREVSTLCFCIKFLCKSGRSSDCRRLFQVGLFEVYIKADVTLLIFCLLITNEKVDLQVVENGSAK